MGFLLVCWNSRVHCCWKCRVELTGHLPVKDRDAQKHDGRISANMVHSPKKLADATVTAEVIPL
ncbi:rCG55873 [Rattus norvegicus]|uniref:RCG55873 n=1 Tax=Rattus norvegicus TaxID=10116 RepID=A6JLV4_RAT|nr:rCG55873 [Rattus norvegicus]